MGFNKKILSKAVSELGKAKAPGKPKDIITDPAGQWKYPGQKTRIPSNDITMQGVPYPVWAQPNVGKGSMMQPNQDYNFPGASYVDETPMAKKGGSKLGTINLNPNPLSHYELNYGFNLPAKENGGEADYEDLDLTDEEIQAYRDGGYVVEELPEAQVGTEINSKPYYNFSNDEATSYNPVTQTVNINEETLTPPENFNGDLKRFIDDEYRAQDAHENFHHYQNQIGTNRIETGRPDAKPTLPSNQNFEGEHYHNRRDIEEKQKADEWRKAHPNESPFINPDILYNKYTNEAMYQDPSTLEGEARDYENYIRQGGKSIFPKKQVGGEPGDKLSKRILKRYPGMQKVYGKEGENLNIIQDPNYNAADYGFGDIEFIQPGSGHVQYSDDYDYQSPTPDKYTAVYNPKGANKHDVFLDTMHGMRNDPEYMKLLDTFSAETKKARGESMDHWYGVDSEQDPYLVADGREQWDNNFIDGVLRSHLAKKGMGRHSSDVKGYKMERQDSTPEMYKATDDIYKYLKGKYEQGGELVKAQGGKTVYSGPNRGLVGPSTPKNNGSPLLPKQDLIKKYQQEVDKAKAAKIAEAEKIRQKAIAKQKAINDAIPRGPVSDNTRTVIPNQVISDINNAAFYKSPQETADREARKKEQAAFEKEQWNKYNKMSFAEKALDRTQAAIAHPILMAGNALTGNQGYIPGMGRGLMNTESPEYDKYLKATGQTKGQFEISDLANIVNPGYWAGNAGNELHKGNYIKGVTDLGFGLMGLKGAKNASGLVKGSANVLNKAESKISKLIPERVSVNTSTENADDLVDLWRIQEKNGKTFAQLAEEEKIHPLFNNPATLAKKAEEEKYFGQWFTKDKNDFDFYKADREFKNPEIINLKVPKSKLEKYSQYDKSLSRAPDREFVIPHDEQSQYINASSNAGNLNAGISPELIKNTIGTGNKVGANILDKAYFSPFFSKAFNRYSPLNLIKGYGSKLEGTVRPLGNVLGKSIKNNKLTGSKPLFGKAKELSTQVGKTDASNIYAAKFDDAVEGSNIRLGEANPQGRFSRKSNATFPIQTKAGVNRYDLPISDPGVALHRRLPFSNKYVPIDKQKLMNNKFQWSTTGAGLQNVAEKYGKGVVGSTLGYGAYNAYNYDKNKPETFATPEEIELANKYNSGQFAESDVPSRAEMFKRGAKEAYESPLDYAKNPDPYYLNSIYHGLNSTQEEKNGGSIESWEDDLDEEEIRLLKEAGFIVEELK